MSFEEGRDAYYKGQTKSSNPYYWEDDSWFSWGMAVSWDKGWESAEEEDFYDD